MVVQSVNKSGEAELISHLTDEFHFVGRVFRRTGTLVYFQCQGMAADATDVAVQQVGETFTGIARLLVLPADTGIDAEFLEIDCCHDIYVLTMNTHCISIVLPGTVSQQDFDRVTVTQFPVFCVAEVVVAEIGMLVGIDRSLVDGDVVGTPVKPNTTS